MNNQTSTLSWHHSQVMRTQPRRISLSYHSERNQKRMLDDQRIITGIKFGKQELRSVKRSTRKTSDLRSRPSATETEPVWISVLGGVGVAIGFVACWILI